VTSSAIKLAFLTSLLWSLLSSPVLSQQVSKPTKYLDRVSFYSNAADGTIAFLPSSNRDGDAKYMTTFSAFENARYYELPKKSNYGFVANITDKTGDRTNPSFLAITIIQAQDPNSDAGAGVELTRNEGWVRDGDATFKAYPNDFREESVDVADIRNWLRLDSMSAFDSALFKQAGRPFSWHARPKDGAISSWDFKRDLFGPATYIDMPVFMKNRFPDLPENCRFRVTSHLMRFTPAQGRVPTKVMDFYVNDCGARRAAIITKCPDYPRYDTLVLIKLK
jgi:hypothetical protein